MKKLIVLLMLCLIGVNCFADDAHGVIEPYLGGFRIQDCDSIEMTDEVVEIWESKVKVTFHFKNCSSYAMHGYEFKSEKWTKLFSNFLWYKPTTSSISEKDLTSEEKAMIKRLTQYR